MSIRRTSVLVSLVLLIPALLLAQKQPHFLFVRAVDQSGAPVLDLKAPDFAVIEGGVKRTVVRADLGTSAMRIALLVDTSSASEPALNQLREGLAAFVDGIPAQDEIALVSIGRQPRVRVKPMTDRTRLKAEITQLFPDGGGTVLLDGVRDTYDQIMKQPEVRWPVYVIVSTDGVDGSGQMNPPEYNRFVDSLRSKGSTIHALILQQGRMGMVVDFSINMAKNTAGTHETIATPNGLPARLKALATRIAGDREKMAQTYQIEFLGDTTRKGDLDVAVRTGVKVERVSQVRPF